MSGRRSTRKIKTPIRYSYDAEPTKDTPLPSTEASIKEEHEEDLGGITGEDTRESLETLTLNSDNYSDNNSDARAPAPPALESPPVQFTIDKDHVALVNSPTPGPTILVDPTTTSSISTLSPTMSNLNDAQMAEVSRAIREALYIKREDSVPNTPTRRALTADLQPSVDYYLLKLDPSVAAVASDKVRYPRLIFTDYNGDIEYNA